MNISNKIVTIAQGCQQIKKTFEVLRRSAIAVGRKKLSFKKQRSRVSETEEVSVKFFISKLRIFYT